MLLGCNRRGSGSIRGLVEGEARRGTNGPAKMED
jgi:hypothetical protein